MSVLPRIRDKTCFRPVPVCSRTNRTWLLEVLVFDRFELAYTLSVPAAVKGTFEESVYHSESNSLTYDSCTESKNVCVVMLAAYLCGVLVVRKCAADALELVACNGDADSGAADRDTLFSSAGKDVISDEFARLNP